MTLFSTFQEIYSGCCTNADCDVLSAGSVVALCLHVLEKHFAIGTLIYVVMIPLRWRLAKGLREGSHTSSNLVGALSLAYQYKWCPIVWVWVSIFERELGVAQGCRPSGPFAQVFVPILH